MSTRLRRQALNRYALLPRPSARLPRGRFLRVEALEERRLLTASFEPALGLPGAIHGDVAWGDVDNDGRLDVVIAGLTQFEDKTEGAALIYRGQIDEEGAVSFERLSMELPQMESAAVALADFDNDGRVDLILSGMSSGGPTTKIYRNEGAGDFSSVSTGLPALENSAIACADYDLDGRIDILLSGVDSNDSPITRLYRNEGDFSFRDIGASLIGVESGSLAWGDYDQDGLPDILVAGTTGSNNGIATVYHNRGNGGFVAMAADLPGIQQGSAAWGDYDQDGLPDILLAGTVGDTPMTAVYRNEGNGAFSEVDVSLTGVEDGVGIWGDYDQDGLLDIFVTGRASSDEFVAILYHNDGDDTFTAESAEISGVINGAAAFADYDGDGRLDLLTTGQLDSDQAVYSTVFWQNTANNVGYTRLAAPAAMAVQVLSDTSVLISWDVPLDADAETPLEGLTYSLRVGTETGGCDVVSPLADADGFRMVAEQGPIGTNRWILEGLTPGQVYYCSVQAIDGDLVTSAFADEGAFSLPVVTLTAPAESTTWTPTVTVTVTNPGMGVADSLAVVIDIDLDGNGDFDGTFKDSYGRSWQETAFARRTLSHGTLTFDLPSLGYDGKYRIRARVDGAGVDGKAIAGQELNVGTSEVLPLAVDATRPSVTINKMTNQADPTAYWPVYFTVEFSEPVVDFDASDITLSGTAPGIFVSAVTPIDDYTYTVVVSGMTGKGTITASIAANSVHDELDNGNTASTSTDNTIVYTVATPTFYLTGPVYNTYQSGDVVTIDWRAKDVGYSSKICLCYDTDTRWNGNEHWIEIDQVAASNGTASYAWNTTGISPGTYYIGGYLWSGGKPTFSHLTRSITIQGEPTTFALTAPGSGTYNVGQNVSIQWSASNVRNGGTISLCYDVDNRWNGNEHWIEIDQVAAANGKGSYTWNTANVAPGTYYVGGYLWSNGRPVFSQLASRVTIQDVPATFSLLTPQTTITAGATVPIRWKAGNYAAGSVVSLCYDTDNRWNGNEHWIEIDQATAASGVFNWDTTGLAAGRYYLGGYLWSNGKATFSRLTSPTTVNAPAATLTFISPQAGEYASGQTLLVEWKASSFAAGSKISLCYDTDTRWNGNEHWIEIDQVTAVEGVDGWLWDSEGVAAGTYYVGGYVYSQGKPTFARLADPITIQTTYTTFALGYVGEGPFAVGDTVPVVWNAGNVASGGTISICLDVDTLWNQNEIWLSVDEIAAVNGRDGRELYTDLIAPGSYYLAGVLNSNGFYYESHMTEALVLNANSSSGSGTLSGGIATMSSSQSNWYASALLDAIVENDAADELATLLAANG